MEDFNTMTIDQLQSKLTVAKIQYKAACASLNDHGIIYYGAKIKRITAKIAKLSTT